MNIYAKTTLDRITGSGKFILVCLISVILGNGMAQAAGGDFAPAKIVNNQAISGYELRQRMAFLQLLRQTGDLETEAMKGLIDDRLRNAQAKANGISLSSEAVLAGMTEFAGRANLTADEFITAIGQAGIAPETFRDFVTSGLAWREVVRQKFSAQIQISEAAIDRALANFAVPVAQNVTLAEISLPATGDGRGAALSRARELRLDILRGRDFAEVARSVSTGSTARMGGLLPPQNLSALPEDVAKAVRVLQSEEISNPIIREDRVVFYKMISLDQAPVTVTAPTQLDYAQLLLPNTDQGLQQANSIRRQVDSCDDLFAVAADKVQRVTLPFSEVPSDIATALQILDAGETSFQLTRGDQRLFLMLCHRGAPINTQASRDEIRVILTNQKLAGMAAVYLEELRADALIVDP
jgi:peptidyl-prolyl cis-trans isomerase SurA